MCLIFFRREEAANRPKVEFVPKTLSDLNIEGVIGVSDGYNGTNSNHVNLFNNHSSSNSYSQNITNTTNGGNQFRRPAPKTVPVKEQLPPDPFDPWSCPQGIFCYFFFLLGLVLIKFCLSPSGTHVTYPKSVYLIVLI